VEEWAHVLNKIDSLDTSVSYKVFIPGVELSEDRIGRARRHVRQHEQREQAGSPSTYRRSRKRNGPHRTRPQSCAVPASVSITVLDSFGNWVSIEEIDNPQTEAASRPVETIGVSVINDHGPSDSVHNQFTSEATTHMAFGDFGELYASSILAQHTINRGSPSRQSCSQAQGYSPCRNSFEFGENIISMFNNEFLIDYSNTQSTLIRRLCTPERITQDNLVAMNPGTPYIFSNPYNNSQNGEGLIWQGIGTTLDQGCNFSLHMSDIEWPPQHQIQSPTYPLSSSDEPQPGSTSVRLATGESFSQILPYIEFEQHFQLVGARLTNPGLAIQGSLFNSASLGFFMEAKSLSKDSFSRTLSLDLLFQNLDAFPPTHGAAVITHSQASETRFIRALLFSLLNGFMGLEDIPTDEILGLFGRLRIFSSSFLKLLRDGPRHASRTFLDNIFRACIEARDTKLLRELLELELLDVNNTVISYSVTLYTPIERAAALRDLDLVEILVNHGADVNKTYSNFRGGAMDKLWCGSFLPKTYASLAAIAKVLIKAGAIMSPDHFVQAWAGPQVDYSDQLLWEAAYQEVLSLAMRSSPSHHEVFFRFGVDTKGTCLTNVARYCSEEFSMQLIHNMIRLCQSDGCGSCLSKRSLTADEAAAVAMSQGKTELVQFLIPYVCDSTMIFVAAIRSKDARLIELALSFQPNLAPHEPIRYPVGFEHLETWPLVEAVGTGNECLTQRLQAAGALHRLDTGRNFHSLMEQAACWGNISYVQMLLCREDTSFYSIKLDITKALQSALDHNNVEIAWLLLDHDGNHVSSRHPSSICLLFEAVKLHNAPLVHAILEMNIELGSYSQLVVDEALKWGNVSVVRDIFTMNPDRRFDASGKLPSLCNFCIAEDNLKLFRDILASLPYLGEVSLGECLAIAVENAHSAMISYLLDQGADPYTPSVLQSILSSQPEMLQTLVDEFALRKKAPKRIGAYKLNTIMGKSFENIEALDARLRMNAIDMIDVQRIELLRYKRLTPLGLAITSSLAGRDGYLSIVEKMLEGGSDPNAIASTRGYNFDESLTGFMLGIGTGYEEVVELLIKYNGKVNTDLRYPVTRTPLQYAAELGNLRMVGLLLSHNAIVNAKPARRGGGTALQFASITGNCIIAEVLLENGAKLDALPSKVHGRWPLEAAAEYGRLDMIHLLWNESIKRKTQVGFQRRQCLRAMKLAHQNGHMGCMNLIEELSGIPIHRLDVEDYGAMWLAYNDFDKEELERIWCIGDGWASTDSITSESKSRRQLRYEKFTSDEDE
jgi:ankyrin repeat protein